MGAPMGTHFIRREGSAGGAMPLRMGKVRSDNKFPEGAADERARKLGSTAGEGRHRAKPLVPEAGLGGTDCAVELLDAGGGNEPDPQETQSDESHVMSLCKQTDRGSTHHSTREAALCVGGIRGDDESEEMHGRREFARESQRECPERKHAQESRGVGQRRGPRRTGAKWRDCDGKQQPQWTSRAHGARANGLKKETEEPGERLDDKSTTCGRKRAGGNKEAQGGNNSNSSGQ